MSTGSGTRDDPWVLTTAPGSSDYTMSRDDDADPAELMVQGEWVPLGAADELKPAADGSVEAFGRAADNPVGGWYGLRKGYRGRFGMYLPPLLEALGLAELTLDKRNNQARAL